MSKKFSKEFIREIVKQELINVLKEQTGTRTATMPQGPFTKGGTPPLGDPTATRVTGPPRGPEGTRMTGPPRGMVGPEGTRVTGAPRMFGPEGTAVDLKPKGMKGGTKVGGRAMQKTAVKKATQAVGKTGLKRIGVALATRAGTLAAGTAASGPLAPIVGAIGTAYMAWDIGSMVYNLFTDDDSKEERADKVIQHIVQIPPEQAQHAAIRAQRFAPGPCKKDKQLGKKLKKAMTDAAKEAGTRSWRGLPYTHPARVDFRAWYKCRPIPSLQNTEQEKEIAMQELVDDPSLV